MHAFAKNGANVWACVRRSNDQFTKYITNLEKETSVTILPVFFDLNDIEQVKIGVKKIMSAKKSVDILVNNAAVSGQSSFIDTSEDELDELLVLNIRSLTQLTRYFLPGMKKRRLGKILNVASVAAFQPVPSLAQYAASKAYVLSLSEALAEELRGTGITVTALCPGVTLTQMVSGTSVSQLPETLVSTPEGVAQAGFDAMMDEQVVHIPGLVNEAAVMLSQLQPRRLIRNLGGLFARFNKGS